MPPELDYVFEHCALHGWGRIPHHTSDTRSCLLSTAVPFSSVFFLFFFFFFLTSMLVKRYIQQLTDLFDGDEELIYGHTFIITHNSSLQALYLVEILVFFLDLEGWGVNKLLWFYNLSGTKVSAQRQKCEIKWVRANISLGDGKRSKSLIIDKTTMSEVL